MVSEKDLDLIQVVDDPEEAVNLVLHGHVRTPSTNGDQRPGRAARAAGDQ